MGERPGKLRRAISPLTWRLTIFALVGVVLLNVGLTLLPSTPDADGARTGEVMRRKTALRDSAAALAWWKRRHHRDSWMPMLTAWQYQHDKRGARFYQDLVLGAGLKMQYPPSSLLLVEPVVRLFPESAPVEERSWLSAPDGAAYIEARDIWAFPPQPPASARIVSLNAIGYALTWCAAVFAALIFMRRCGDLSLAPRSGVDRAVRFAIALGLAWSFYPIVRALSLGQVQAWLNAGLVLSVWLWMNRRERAAGVVWALLSAVKPQYGLVLIWLLLRRRWGSAAAFAITLGGVMLVALGVYGWQNHIDYVSVLRFIARGGESYLANQSVNGLLHRWVDPASGPMFHLYDFAPYVPLVYFGTLATSAMLIGASLFMPRSGGSANGGAAGTRGSGAHAWAGGVADLLIVLLTATMASPVAWEHHYGVLLPIFAWLMPGLIAEARWGWGRVALVLGSIAYVLSSNFFGITHAFDTRAAALLQSYVFFAALIVLGLLYRARRSGALTASQSSAPR